MKKFKSIGDFRAFAARLAEERNDAYTLIIPAGTCGRAGGALELAQAAQDELEHASFNSEVKLRLTGCHGFCEMEPSILVDPQRTFYPRVRPQDIGRIIKAAADGTVVESLLWLEETTGKRLARQEEVPFFRKQVRTILSRNEQVDPGRIEDYIRAGGYGALAGALEQGRPEAVLAEVKKSGLRGRGGAGFPTGVKWELLAKQSGKEGKYLVCNADEGDPGAYMDRSVLEGNPHSILEGMLIGAFATGADTGIIYVRKEYPLAIEHVQNALRQARNRGLLGEHIMGSPFSFDIQVVHGAGAFVCGEETSLIRSIEGFMGEPRQRPPFPIQSGILGKPTGINNVETWANIPVIISEGGDAFARIGTENNSGTKIFSLVGKIRNTGLVEVPMGTTIEEIVRDIGGGAVNGAKIKAVQTGGPSGGCIPVGKFDLPINYDSLSNAGSIMGSGGMIVIDDHTCVVDLAKYFMAFLKDESCGKCFSCRKGTQRMHEILEDITMGHGSEDQLLLLEELALVVKDTTLCGLGQTAANPVLSTLRYFRDEYLTHIRHRRCPAGVCAALITYSINENCSGCQACLKVCGAEAITGERKQRHRIDPAKCIKCGSCRSVCTHNAVEAA